MAPSPRKRAPRTTPPAFDQTWDVQDAAFLDPSSLPVAKIPRGWERKPQITKIGEGKERKIWRRFNLRSRAENAAEEQDAEVEEHDARSRAVKRRQHMSPEAMEKTTSRPNGKKRAFQATRWDRRKSLLPRKKATRTVASPIDAEEESEDDTDESQHVTEEVSDNVADVVLPIDQSAEEAEDLVPVASEDRRSTFTFTMDANPTDQLLDFERLDGLEGPEPASTEDAALVNLFRSPVSRNSPNYIESPEKIFYPQLPQSGDPNMDGERLDELDGIVEETEDNIGPQLVDDEFEQSASLDEDTLEQQAEANEDEESRVADVQLTAESPATSTTIAYPDLPIDSPTSQGSEDGVENAAEPETTMVAQTNEPLLAVGPPVLSDEEELSDEEFTEASLQLDIQREYIEAQQQETTSTEAHELDAGSDEVYPQNREHPDPDTYMDDGSSPVEEMPASHIDALDAEKHWDPPSPDAEDMIIQPESPAQSSLQDHGQTPVDDITNGLTLSFTPARISSADPTPRKLQSPPPPPRSESGLDDVTMTIAIDDDTAILKNFLNRAAASKAEKAATHRRESLHNHRDSDVIRHALASPRRVLEDKDPNSPSKYTNELMLDLSQTLTLSLPSDNLASPTPGQTDDDDVSGARSSRGSRRSSREKKSRLPAPASAPPSAAPQTQTSKISIRRADGNEVIVLKKSDAQELSTLTRANTRKNKQGAFGVTIRLLKLAADSAGLPPIDGANKELIVGKNIRWDEQLAYYQENPETVAEAESLATPDELGMSDGPSATKPKAKTSNSTSTPKKIRRVRGLGTVNGTPGKGLLAPSSPLPDTVQQDSSSSQPSHTAHQQHHLPRPTKASKLNPKLKKLPIPSLTPHPEPTPPAPPVVATKLPSLDGAPVGVSAPTPRNSRIAAPRRVGMPVAGGGGGSSGSSGLAEGKENVQVSVQRSGGLGGSVGMGMGMGMGIADATPKKGIPVPAGKAVGMESGLPRRRGRKY